MSEVAHHVENARLLIRRNLTRFRTLVERYLAASYAVHRGTGGRVDALEISVRLTYPPHVSKWTQGVVAVIDLDAPRETVSAQLRAAFQPDPGGSR